MQILELMNTNPNWMEIIQAEPYFIKIKQDGDYILLEYNQLCSDFNEPIVRECRGSIFRQEGAQWICVCHPFDKFGNYGEAYVPEIDWQSAVVYEKIDGSLMKMWYDRGEWHLSTNGTIDAFKAPLGDFGMSFGDYFYEILKSKVNEFVDYETTPTQVWNMLCCSFRKYKTYMFEMVGPKNRVVINYEKPDIYLLGARNINTHEEIDVLSIFFHALLNKPKIYHLRTLEDCLAAAEKMSRDEEGFVVCDGNFNRAKIKSPEYLMAARLRNNGVITRRRLLQIIWEGKGDDFVSYCPQYRTETENMLDKYLEYVDYLYCLKKQFAQYKSLHRHEYWELAKKYGYHSGFIMKNYDNDLSVNDYITHQVELRGIDWLLERIDPVD